MGNDSEIIKNYAKERLGETILGLLPPGEVTSEKLAAFDELHIGGRAATGYLFAALGLRRGMKILDIGSGLGGAARFAAETYDVSVAGIDLTPDYCSAASMLSEKAGLAGAVEFHVGNALAMPFGDQSFDAAYTIHAAMNIEDKLTLYREANRVLKPGALFGIYDVLAGTNEDDLTFPLPWSGTAATSFLVSVEDMVTLLERAGFEILQSEERNLFAMKALEKAAAGKNPGAIALTSGTDFTRRIANLSMAIGDSRCAVRQVVARKKG